MSFIEQNSSTPTSETGLFEQHLSLVETVASKYRTLLTASFDLEDAKQEGCIGLMNAIAEFDPSKGSFRRYAYFWIKKHILEAVADQSRLMRLPESAIRVLLESNRQISAFENMHGKSPTTEEIAAEMDIHPEYLNDILQATNKIISLDIPLSKNDRKLEEIIPDDTAISHLSVVVAKESIAEKVKAIKAVRKAVAKLPSEHETVLRLRYMLGEKPSMDPDVDDERTFKEVGTIIGTDKRGAWGRHSRAITRLAKDPELCMFWERYQDSLRG